MTVMEGMYNLQIMYITINFKEMLSKEEESNILQIKLIISHSNFNINHINNSMVIVEIQILIIQEVEEV